MSTPPPGRTRTALVTGVAGQDGVYLARHLRSLGYHVVGTLRPGSRWAPLTLGRAYAYLDGVTLVDLDQRDHEGWAAVLEGLRPDEVYNLAGFTSVGASWGAAETVAEANGMAVLRMLEELIRFRDRHGWAPRFFQPSSSEMFGVTDQQPQTENTPHHPRSPYAASKSFAHHLVVNYRESYDLHASSGILFNHESPRQGLEFVTRKISNAVAKIKLGLATELALGNLEAQRDWGFAKDYVEAMWLMLQQDEPSDFVVATGETHSVREFCELAFGHVGLDYTDHVVIDERFFRPAEVELLVGEPTRAAEVLGWKPSTSFEDLVRLMVDADVAQVAAINGIER